MNLKEQLYVCTLAQTGSLSKAAQLLFISQPALSLYISNLEKQLGIQLFDRIGKQFTLTYAGELYVEQAKKMLAMKETFDSKISELINGRCERLRVGIQSIRSANMAPYLLPRLESSCERLKIFWKEDFYQNLEKMLLEDQLDVFLCSCSTPKKEFVYYPFFQDEVVFFTGANHPMGKYAQKRPDLISHGLTYHFLRMIVFLWLMNGSLSTKTVNKFWTPSVSGLVIFLRFSD